MRADLYCDKNFDFFCIKFPEASLCVEVCGRDGQVYGIDDQRANFWTMEKLVKMLHIPFDLVARIYCNHKNFKLHDFTRAEYELWQNQEVSALIKRTMREAEIPAGPVNRIT